MPHSDLHRCFALRRCRRQNWDPAEALAGQYAITPSPDAPVSGWTSTQVGTWCLHACPSLDRAACSTCEGAITGVLLGVAVDPLGRVIDDRTPWLEGIDKPQPDALSEPIGARVGAMSHTRCALVTGSPAPPQSHPSACLRKIVTAL
jgi:hypothetical protein